MISRQLLQTYGWPDGPIIERALEAAEALRSSGLSQDAVLVWLDQVCNQPASYLCDPVLAPLAHEYLRVADREPACSGSYSARS